MKPEPLDTLLAFKALALMPGMTLAQVRVAAAIVDHFNRRNTRCDPGVERLTVLLGLDRSTVIRAIDRLHRAGIIVRIRHGGFFQRNRYEPAWDVLIEFARTWSVRKKNLNGGRRSVAAAAPPEGSRPRDVARGEAATQTYLENLSTEPIDAAANAKTGQDGARGEAERGQAREERRTQSSAQVHRGRNPQQSSEAALVAAERRWSTDLLERFRSDPEAYAYAIERIDRSLQDDATMAEMRRRGAGIELIVNRLSLPAIARDRGNSPIDKAGEGAPGEGHTRVVRNRGTTAVSPLIRRKRLPRAAGAMIS